MELKLFDPARTGRWCELVEIFLDHDRAGVARGLIDERAFETRARYVRSFGGFFRGEEPRNSDLLGWLNAHPEWNSAHTLRNAASYVIHCAQWLQDEDLIPKHRLKKRTLGLPKGQPRNAMSIGDVDVFLRAIKYCRGHTKSRAALRIAVWFLVRTGCRTCEMRNLRWREIDFVRGVAVLRQHKTANATGEARVIVLPRVVLRILRRHRQPSGYVFTNGRGLKWKREGLARTFKRYLVRVGLAHLDVTPYSIRHGFCSACLDLGIRDTRIAKLLGHTSTKLVAYYGKTAKKKIGRLRKCVDRVARKRPK